MTSDTMTLRQIKDAVASGTEFITSDESGNFIGIIPDDIYGMILKMRVDGEIRMTAKYLDRPDVAAHMLQIWSDRLEIER